MKESSRQDGGESTKVVSTVAPKKELDCGYHSPANIFCTKTPASRLRLYRQYCTVRYLRRAVSSHNPTDWRSWVTGGGSAVLPAGEFNLQCDYGISAANICKPTPTPTVSSVLYRTLSPRSVAQIQRTGGVWVGGGAVFPSGEFHLRAAPRLRCVDDDGTNATLTRGAVLSRES